MGRGRSHHVTPPRAPRILVIRPDHLGDLILAGPTGRALRSALPNAAIDWMVGPWGDETVRRAAAPNRVLTCRFPGFTRSPKSSLWGPYAELVKQAAGLRAHRYDIAIVARPDHWWGALLADVAGIPCRVGFDVPECQPFLTHALPPGRIGHAVDEGLVLARLAARLVDPAARVPNLDPAFSVEAADRDWAERRLAPIAHTASIVAVHPGSGGRVKNWLPDRWREVLARLVGETGCAVVLTGGQDERPMLSAVARGLEPTPLVVAAETGIGQLAAIFERCALVLGVDSGPLHLAAAVGARTLRLYGPTDPARFGPRADTESHAVIAATLPCQPCGNIVTPPCGATGTPACMRAISVAQIVEAVAAVPC